MKPWLPFLALALPLAAARAGAPANPYDDRLRSLDVLTQASVLRRAILDDGGRCGRVVRTLARGGYANLRMWEAQCDRGGDYAVFVGTDSSVQVRACGTLRSLKLPPCVLAAQPNGRPGIGPRSRSRAGRRR